MFMTFPWRTGKDITSPPNPGGAFVNGAASEPKSPYVPELHITAEGRHARLDNKPCSCFLDWRLYVEHPQLCPEYRSINQELRGGTQRLADAVNSVEDQS